MYGRTKLAQVPSTSLVHHSTKSAQHRLALLLARRICNALDVALQWPSIGTLSHASIVSHAAKTSRLRSARRLLRTPGSRPKFSAPTSPNTPRSPHDHLFGVGARRRYYTLLYCFGTNDLLTYVRGCSVFASPSPLYTPRAAGPQSYIQYSNRCGCASTPPIRGCLKAYNTNLVVLVQFGCHINSVVDHVCADRRYEPYGTGEHSKRRLGKHWRQQY